MKPPTGSIVLVSLGLLGLPGLLVAQTKPNMPWVLDVEPQPLIAQAQRIAEMLEKLGEPLDPADQARLQTAFEDEDDTEVIEGLQRVLDRYCIAAVAINNENRTSVITGPKEPVLLKQGWRAFLVKVVNTTGTTAPVTVDSPNAKDMNALEKEKRTRWLDLKWEDEKPLQRNLSGLELEYRVLSLYSRDAGKREARFRFYINPGEQDDTIDILFRCRQTKAVSLEIIDENGLPTTGSLLIKDRAGRVYPARNKRMLPDLHFQPHIYRSHGETVQLPDGEYMIRFSKGPETIPTERKIAITDDTGKLSFKVDRWIDPSKRGWWSGDHHVHAAGCRHYRDPSQGVHAEDMIRQTRGQDLKVAFNLTWHPCFNYQKQFFTGKADKVSDYPYLMRYDIETSGFGPHKSIHLCLLNLKEQIPPGGDSDQHWPTLGLNVIKWAKKQGALVGTAHSGWGLQVPSTELPNYIIPPFNGIGANEYIMDVTHEVEGENGELVPAVDFFGTVDTPSTWELNIWYHTLNCGFRPRIGGETDFPCLFEVVGWGRSYIKVDGKLDLTKWTQGLKNGRGYVSEGKSHLFDFKIDDQEMGVGDSELKFPDAGNVRVSVNVAARLDEEPHPEYQNLHPAAFPFWDLERTRIGTGNKVPLEVIVNGFPAARKEIVADGGIRPHAFDIMIDRSSWVAVRILPSSHTNPIFVIVGGEPIRELKSAEWCLESAKTCWEEKKQHIAEAEFEDAKNAYAHAFATYQRIIDESKQP